MIGDFAQHLVDRYGVETVSKFYFEVWNEPGVKEVWSHVDEPLETVLTFIIL